MRLRRIPFPGGKGMVLRMGRCQRHRHYLLGTPSHPLFLLQQYKRRQARPCRVSLRANRRADCRLTVLHLEPGQQSPQRSRRRCRLGTLSHLFVSFLQRHKRRQARPCRVSLRACRRAGCRLTVLHLEPGRQSRQRSRRHCWLGTLSHLFVSFLQRHKRRQARPRRM